MSSPDFIPGGRTRLIRAALVERASLHQGDIIGSYYRVERIIGSGGFGLVFLAYDLNSGATYAVKSFKEEFLFNDDVRKDFEREAQVWIGLGSNPFIVQAHHIRRVHDRLFVGMDYVAPDENGLVSLHDHIAFHGKAIKSQTIGLWFIELCQGLEHSAARGVLAHRDLKPMNLLIGCGPFLRVSDFGLAASLGGIHIPPAARPDMSQVASVLVEDGKSSCGTPGYIAPEVFRGEGADARSDIYSCGIILWQLCAGSRLPPFAANFDGDFAKYMHHLYALQMKAAIPELASPFWDVITRCVHPDPDRRYQDFASLRHAIKACMKVAGDAPVDFMFGDQKESFASLLNQGANLKALKRIDEALQCYEKAARLDPNNPLVWVNIGNAYSAGTRHLEALAAYDKALKVDPRCEMALLNKAIALQSEEKHGLALECLKALEDINPVSLEALRRRGKSLLALGKMSEAIAACDRALATSPRDARSWATRGDCHERLGNIAEAERCYDEACVADPTDASLWARSGDLAGKAGNFKRSLGRLDVALTLAPADVAIMNTKGIVLCRAERYDEAIALFDDLLRASPADKATLWTNKGNAFFDSGRSKEAIPCFDSAIAANSMYVHAWSRKAQALSDLGRQSEAIPCYRKAIELAPNRFSSWYELASVYLLVGDPVSSLPLFDEALRLMPQHPGCLYNKAVALAQANNDMTGALDCLRRATSIDSKYQRAWYLRAYIEKLSGLAGDTARSCEAFLMLGGAENSEEAKNVRQWLRELRG